MMIKHFIYGIVWVMALLFVSCLNKSSSSQEENKVSAKVNPLRLLDKQLLSIDSILENKEKQKTVLLLFNYYDCGSCIDSAFQLVKRIDESNNRKMVSVISTMGSPIAFQVRNHYEEYVYSDDKDLIRKELKYVQTPILILLDAEKRIKCYMFPNVSDKQECDSFMEAVSNLK